MKKVTQSLLATSVLAACGLTSGVALAEVSMNVGVTSNYIWRGVTQTDDEAAVSGGVDYNHASGLYAGIWASSLGNLEDDGGTPADPSDDSSAGAEVDYYVGFANTVGDFGYDISLARISYPQMTDWDFTELGLSGSYSYFTVGVNSTIASEVDDTTAGAEAFIDGDMYYYASVAFPLQGDYSIGATAGSYQFEDDGVGGADMDYTHYQLSLTKSAGDFGDVTFAIDKNNQDDVPATANEEDSARFSVSWSKSF